MGSWKRSLLVVALGLLGAGCAEDQANANHANQSHYAARRPVTGSNLPQAPAYGDGVGSLNQQDAMNTMERNASTSSSLGGGMAGGGGGGR